MVFFGVHLATTVKSNSNKNCPSKGWGRPYLQLGIAEIAAQPPSRTISAVVTADQKGLEEPIGANAGSILSLFPLVLSLRLLANAHSVGDHTLESRDFVDELSVREPEFTSLDARDTFSDISTRELIDELSDRLERRVFRWHCKRCQMEFTTNKPTGMSAVCGKKRNIDHILGLDTRTGIYTCHNCKRFWHNSPKGMDMVCFKHKDLHELQHDLIDMDDPDFAFTLKKTWI
ncbi:hypothetical protein DFP72DRAFT_1048322 [Ephemerocybe angulata]|uniref:C2H2-type domain-containing protein n=1 Tax=Ephemerocybe angulata TaxID=980116 RepID=A0A8H6M3V9_9AGAR|nr:hypothetical protein DFP72DRAFT_1048322 [Tulosesus angulatus]